MDISRTLIEKPRFIEVEKFVESRTNSIAQLLKAIDNEALVSGEVTKGPRTAAQRLPRHMRRRAMAYEVRRFPKGMREFAAAHIISNHRKKPPSRFARRKPTNILQSYSRRQMKNGKWLETHIWHAKRFRMVRRWGFKLADRSFQRGFRAIIRDSNRNCVIRDRSFLTCIIVSNPNQQSIFDVVNQFCSRKCGILFSSEQTLKGTKEFSIQLYSPGKYPSGYIGPARFQWIRSDESSKLCLWIHPASKDQFLTEFEKLLNLKKVEDMEEKKEEDVVNFVSENDEKMIIEVFPSTFNRLRLYGPSSVKKLASSIRLTDLEEFRKHHENWRIVSSKSCAGLRIEDGTIFSLSIEDPRTCWDRTNKIGSRKLKKDDETDFDLEKPSTSFWNPDDRQTAREKRMTAADFEKKNSELIDGIKTTEAKIPILVIVRNLNLSVLDGLEVLVPQAFGKDLWIALQRRGVRASGIRDDSAGHLEAKSLCFPNDDVDSEAGKEYEKWKRGEMEAKNNSRPHNRRCKFWSALSIKYPFDYHFDELVNSWKTISPNETGPIVCRDVEQLARFDDLLKGKLNTIAPFDDNLLVPVRLDFFGRGRPKKFGIICVPQDQDLTTIRFNRNKEIIQPPRSSIQECEPMEVDTIEEKPKEEFKFQEFVSLDPSSREKPISLKALFECSEKFDEKVEKRRKINRKKKEASKRRKIEMGKRLDQEELEENEKQGIEYRFSANREILGRVMSGEQSLLGGRGVALGYICANSISKIAGNYAKSKSVVLVRNSTSKYYHPAIVTVIRTHNHI